MNNEELAFQKAFSSWKIWLAVFLGLTIASWMIYHALQQENFVELKGKGQFSWVDTNKNGIIDTNNPNEFVPAKNGDFRRETIADTLQFIRWDIYSFIWLSLALVGMVGRDFFYMARIRVLTKKQLSWRQCFDVIMLWEFASALSPGVVGGTTVAMFILKKEKIDLGRSTAIVMITALLDNLFYLLLIPFVFLFIAEKELFPTHFSASKSVATIFWTGFGVKLILCFFLFFSIFLKPELAAALLKKICRLPLLNKWYALAEQTGNEIILAAATLKQEKFSFWIQAMGTTCLSWISRYLVINCILSAFIHLSFLQHILLLGKQLVLWLLMMISPTPGGSGVAEFAFGQLLSTFSSSLILIAALALIWRLISYFPYLFIGAIVLPKWLKKK